eukprot:366191-Chlamydomonas_euryale.AAC.9
MRAWKVVFTGPTDEHQGRGKWLPQTHPMKIRAVEIGCHRPNRCIYLGAQNAPLLILTLQAEFWVLSLSLCDADRVYIRQ